jgi:diguanylate cyclase (GGDEF)-like protein/PAS domain S-box-containing protein
VLDRSSLRGRVTRANPGALLCAAGGVTAAIAAWAGDVLPMVPGGVLIAQAVLALSLFARARAAAGRVRLRLTLLGASAVAAAAHEAATGLLTARPGWASDGSWPGYGLIVMVALAVMAGTAVAGLVVAAECGDGHLRWARRLLDGVMIAGSLFTLGWTSLWQRAHIGASVLVGVSAVSFSLSRILVLGIVVSLWFAVRREERSTVTVAAVGMLLLVTGDAMSLWSAPPDALWPGPGDQGLRIAGLLITAVSPWTPGGGSLLEAGRREPAVPGVVAALLPLTICGASAIVQVLAWNRLDPLTLAVSAAVLVTLGVRQGVTQAENLRLLREVAAREAYFRFLVQESSDAIMVAGPDGVLRYVSPAVRYVLGHRQEDLLGTSLVHLTHPDDHTSLRRVARGSQDGGDRPSAGVVEHISCRMRAADGQWRHIESAVSTHAEGAILSSRDVTARVARQARLEHLAFHDALTGLPNRALFADRVNHALKMRSAAIDPPTVLFVDLDGFKAVNDTAGHAAGDEVLIQTARRLQGAVRAGDTVARLGGDEFAALLGQGSGSCEAQARAIAERLLLALSQPYGITGSQVTVAASIGMAVASPGITADELLRNADLAMYRAKAAGKGRVVASPRGGCAPNLPTVHAPTAAQTAPAVHTPPTTVPSAPPVSAAATVPNQYARTAVRMTNRSEGEVLPL